MPNNGAKLTGPILTIPNLLSFVRILLIPGIVWLYCWRRADGWAALLLLLSGLTDIADGFIARRFHMVSDFGKILDPVADKLTQGAMLLCLLSRFRYMALPLIFFGLKELFAAVTGLLGIRRTGTVRGAAWHGKLTTVSLYAMVAVHLLWAGIPPALSYLLVGLCMGIMALSFALYAVRNLKLLLGRDRSQSQ